MARAAATSRFGVTEVDSLASSGEKRVAKGGVPGLALGGAEPDGQIEPEDWIGVGDLGVEVEGLGVVAESVGRGQGAECGVARLAGVADGLGQVDGLGGDPVAGQFAHPRSGAIAAEFLQSLGHVPVGPRPAGRTEVLVEGVLDEGVGEVEPSRGVGQFPHEGHRRRGIQHVEDIIFAAVRRDRPRGRDRSPGR